MGESMDTSTELTLESLMISFLDTVEYPGKDEEVQKLTLNALKENLLTARCMRWSPWGVLFGLLSLRARTRSRWWTCHWLTCTLVLQYQPSLEVTTWCLDVILHTFSVGRSAQVS